METVKTRQWLLLILIPLVFVTQGCPKTDTPEPELFVPNAETEYDGNSFRLVALYQRINIDGENLYIDDGQLIVIDTSIIPSQNEIDAVFEIIDLQQEVAGLVLPPQPKPCPVGSEGACQLKLADIRCSVFSDGECLEIYPIDLPGELILIAVPGSEPALNEFYAGQRYVEIDYINEGFVGDATGAYKHNTGQMYYFNTHIVE